MARDTHVLKDFEARLREAGAAFVRVTGKGYRRWHLKAGKTVTIVDLPTKGYEFGHQKKNVEAEIKRALKACGRLPREVPKVERAVARTAPVQVAEEVSAPSPSSRGGDQTPDVARDAHAVDVERGPADVRGDAPGGPEEEAPGLLAHEESVGAGPLQEAAYVCETCGESFARPLNLGRHRQARHGIAGLHRAKPAKVADGLVAKLALEATPAASQSGGWRFAEAPARPVLTGPPPLGMTRPTATLVAGTATMEKVAALAEALAAAARDLVTEYRLVREENTRLTEAVQQMERMFEGLRRR